MDVLLDPDEVLREDVHLGRLDVALDALALTRRHDFIHVLLLVDASHIPGIEHVVQILQHLLINDLRVTEEEGHLLVLHTRDHESLRYDTYYLPSSRPHANSSSSSSSPPRSGTTCNL